MNNGLLGFPPSLDRLQAIRMGEEAGVNAPSGTIAIGYQAGRGVVDPGLDTSGVPWPSNIFIGRGAGYTAGGSAANQTTTAYGQVFIGENSGGGNTSQAPKAICIGVAATATQDSAVSIGAAASATGQLPVAVGSSATASGQNSVAVGFGATASGGNATAVGKGASASNSNANVVGGFATASGVGSTAIGTSVSATASGAIAIGRDSSGTASFSGTTDLASIGTGLTSLRCGNPGGGQGAWMLGKFTAGAVVLDAANYVEVKIDGTVRKLLVAA